MQALVIGASGAIGAAFVRALRERADVTQVYTLARSGAYDALFDLTDEHSITQAASSLREKLGDTRLQLVIDATGALTIEGRGPEKSLAAIDAHTMQRNMQINAIGPLLLLKSLAPLLNPNPTVGRSIYAKLSARVGSISDNRKGGWYGYRASKAALNMLLHTAAIELQRRNPELIVAALQPGTVATPLSAPFAKPEDCLTPDASAQALLAVLMALTPTEGAQFVDWRGEKIAW
jgi:NAD(P)-dependent dehydrogenase (short-subunit alcohol dehydrogenase family)